MNGLAIDSKSSEELVNHNNNQTTSCVNDSNNVLNHKNLSKIESIEDMNGFCDEKRESFEETTRLSQFGTNSDINIDNSSKGIRKYVKYKTNDLCLASGVEEEGVSTTSTSTSGQSPTANSQTASLTNSAEKVSHKKSQNNSKLRIGRSFNITANFSDEEEVVSDRRPSSRRKKVTQI